MSNHKKQIKLLCILFIWKEWNSTQYFAIIEKAVWSGLLYSTVFVAEKLTYIVLKDVVYLI